MYINQMKEAMDISKFNDIAKRYKTKDDKDLIRLEATNKQIEAICSMEIPPLEAYDQYLEQLESDILVRKCKSTNFIASTGSYS